MAAFCPRSRWRHWDMPADDPDADTPPAAAHPAAVNSVFPLQDPDFSWRTRYGASADSVVAAAAVLRARTVSNRVELAGAGDADLAAAAIGADAWMWITGAEDLNRPAQYGPGAVAVLAAILARAGGHRRYVTGEVLDDVTPLVSPDAVELVEAYRDWVGGQLGGVACTPVLLRAAADLSAGRRDARAGVELDLVRMAALFETLSGGPERVP